MWILIRKLIFISLLAIFTAALALPCCAAEEDEVYDIADKSFDEIISDFMAEFGLTEENFAMGWHNCGTGETRYINGEDYFVAGSMYKLPLAMNYIHKFADGTFEPTDITDGYQLTILIDLAIRYSDNDAAARLRRHYTPDHMAYRRSLANFSDVDPETLPTGFYTDNRISPHIMLDTLKELYANQEFYAQIIENMLLAHPDHFFRKNQGKYEIAHKYGSFENALNDCAIVYTPTPFLLVAFTDHIWNAEAVLSALVQRLTAYSLRLDREAAQTPKETPIPEPTPTPRPQPTDSPAPPETPQPAPLPSPETPEPEDADSVHSPATSIIITVAAAFLLLCASLCLRRKKAKNAK